jgi:hypothetical protein
MSVRFARPRALPSLVLKAKGVFGNVQRKPVWFSTSVHRPIRKVRLCVSRIVKVLALGVVSKMVVVIYPPSCHNGGGHLGKVALPAGIPAARPGVVGICEWAPLSQPAPNTACSGWWGVCAFLGRWLALGFSRFDKDSTLRPTTTNTHR